MCAKLKLDGTGYADGFDVLFFCIISASVIPRRTPSLAVSSSTSLSFRRVYKLSVHRCLIDFSLSSRHVQKLSVRRRLVVFSLVSRRAQKPSVPWRGL
nr:hypothetical protein Iba_chr04bCG18760 [Ipomoea batatas]